MQIILGLFCLLIAAGAGAYLISLIMEKWHDR